ncbi:MAG: hypothetical protein DLM53_12580 [Candidatus Eremiobacter antarcticus]|nr:hypothetical protein [Candidatus Eremiobacteraeota bacterium]MBC5807698.1 hypothetical protein [Candidatus Eremiobacteraeota bacterium]PZR60482.1 MAG: hypothetical protein DLM53_12580 [Candidatus Eremiobacter sp. RRmetagenome_bin22]
MNLQDVVKLVDGFHITDRRLLRARKALQGSASQNAAQEFCRQALRYFRSLEREADDHIRTVDRRLDDIYQRQYNLQAERAVAQRRRDNAREVVAALSAGDTAAPSP